MMVLPRNSLRFQHIYKSFSKISANLATTIIDVSTSDLKVLSLIELKELSKSLGGKTSNMRKSQIIDVCLQLLMKSNTDKVATNFSTAAPLSSTILAVPPYVASNAAIIPTSSSLYPSSSTLPLSERPSPSQPQSSLSQPLSSSSSQTLPSSLSQPAPSSSYSSSSSISTTSSSSITTSPSSKGRTYVRRLQPIQPNTAAPNTSNNNNSTTVYTPHIDEHKISPQQQSQQQQSPQYHGKKAFSIDQKFPTGLNRMDRFDMYNTSDMDITFLGTASCVPSVSRGVSSIAFRCRTKLWLFDCGESTQIQLQKSSLRPSKISKIFLTHLHGDHSFGIPGVLCMLGQSTQDERGKAYESGDVLEPLDIYGPEGTRDYIRAVTALTYSRIAIPHRIHELKNIPFLHSRYTPYKQRPNTAESNIKTHFVPTFGEREGGTDIYPDEKTGIYTIFDDEEITVHAAPMQHSVPCVGFAVTEKDRVGRLNVELAQTHVEGNKMALGKIMKDYRKTYTLLKNLKPGTAYQFPDGTNITAEQVLEPSRVGRKVVLLGDTCNADRIASVCQNADIVVHEATNAWDTQSVGKYLDYRQFEHDTLSHGHSTPQIAGRFAKLVNADKLILTHFSPRYRGDESEFSMKTMWQLEDMARIGSGYLFKPNDVIAAWDQLCIPIIPKEVYVTNNATYATASSE